MNWDFVQDTWKQVADKTRAHWSKLTGDDFSIETGRCEQRAGNSPKRHGVSRKDVDNEMSEKQRKAIDLWFARD